MNRNVFKHGYWAASRGLQSQEVGSHNDIHTVSDHWSHLYQALSLESALCKILDVQKGNASFEHMLNPGWGSAVLLSSHLWLGLLLNMATELPPGGLQIQEVGSHNDIHTVSDHWSHLYQTLSLESALCKILDVQKGNASFEHIFNPRWGSVVLLGSHLWIGVFLNMAIGRCKVFLHSYVYWQNSAGNFSPQKKLFNVAVGRNHENLAVGRSKNLSRWPLRL